MNLLIRDLISAACSELQHDTDVLEGVHDYEVSQRNSLESLFKRVLKKHKIKYEKLENKPEGWKE